MSERNKTQTHNGSSGSGAKKVSLSFRIDDGVIEHNNRDFIAKNVVRERIPNNITYKKESLTDKYHELFDKAVEEYNAKKTRADRRISDYLEHIRSPSRRNLSTKLLYKSEIRTIAELEKKMARLPRRCWTNICASLKNEIRI